VSARRRGEVLAIVVRALLLLPFALALWYLAAFPAGWVAAKVASPAIAAAAGDVRALSWREATAIYHVAVEGPYRPGRPVSAEADVEIETGRYTFGIALFAALSLAWRGAWRWKPLAAGAAVLLVVPAWGIAFDALRQLGQAAALAPLIGWSAGAREGIALGFQVGSLLLPTLLPVAMFLAFNPAAWWPAEASAG
jgi:hypothetical protein